MYDDMLNDQIAQARESQGTGNLQALLESANAWDVEAS